jgi:hypothetical protein
MTVSPDRDLVDAFAREVLASAAPEELAVFDETAEEFHRDPDKVLSTQGRDEAVGFGLDLALITPYVLAVAAPVLSYLLNAVGEAAKSEAQPVIKNLVHRLFHRRKPADGTPEEKTGTGDDADDEAISLSPAELAEVREVALARATDLGLPVERARLLADAVVGGLNVAPA